MGCMGIIRTLAQDLKKGDKNQDTIIQQASKYINHQLEVKNNELIGKTGLKKEVEEWNDLKDTVNLKWEEDVSNYFINESNVYNAFHPFISSSNDIKIYNKIKNQEKFNFKTFLTANGGVSGDKAETTLQQAVNAYAFFKESIKTADNEINKALQNPDVKKSIAVNVPSDLESARATPEQPIGDLYYEIYGQCGGDQQKFESYWRSKYYVYELNDKISQDNNAREQLRVEAIQESKFHFISTNNFWKKTEKPQEKEVKSENIFKFDDKEFYRDDKQYENDFKQKIKNIEWYMTSKPRGQFDIVLKKMIKLNNDYYYHI